MTYTYDLNQNGCLILKADPAEREMLKALANEHGEFTSEAEYAALEHLLANSELDWIQPEEIGALTSAPILGFRKEPTPLTDDVDSDKVYIVGRWEDANGKLTTWYEPVEAAWGFMDYALRSFIQDLIDKGQAVFVS